jgi:23S rRNA (guanine745-N1)-methyltransferase
VVADAWRALPVRSGVAAAVLDVFAPRNGPETARVLRPGGLLVVVTPAEDHLGELVGALGLLIVDERKQARLAAALEPHLTAADSLSRRWSLSLDRRAALAAVAMGPSARHLSAAELADRTAALPDPVEVTAAVDVRTYRRD